MVPNLKIQIIPHTIDIFTLATLEAPLGAPLGAPGGPKIFFSFKNIYPQPILMIPDLKNPKHCSYN